MDNAPVSQLPASQPPLYQTLADDLMAQILQGVYRPGDKLPSVRQLAQQQAVSVSTAVSAYQQLELTGLISAREKSGIYVNASPQGAAVSTPAMSAGGQPTQLQMSNTIARIFAHNRDRSQLHFDLAVPAAEMQPGAQLRASVNRVLRQSFSNSLQLIPAPGDLELRRLIAQRMNGRGSRVQPEDIVLTNGCQEALLVSIQALSSPGDLVAVETPCYYGFLQALESLGLKAIAITTDPVTGLDMESLELALKRWPIRLCVCSPTLSNPTGACLPDSARRQLLRLAHDYDFHLIEDDIFGELCHRDDGNMRPLHALDRHGRVIYCSSFSKSLSPGLRLGWVAAGEQRLRVMERQRATTTGTASLTQLQVRDYLKSGHYDKHLRRVRRLYEANLQRALAVIARAFPPGTQATRPSGGFVLWVSLPSGHDAMQLLDLAQRHHIGFVPGAVFAQQGLEHCLRLSVAQPWSPALEAGLVTLGQLAGKG